MIRNLQTQRLRQKKTTLCQGNKECREENSATIISANTNAERLIDPIHKISVRGFVNKHTLKSRLGSSSSHPKHTRGREWASKKLDIGRGGGGRGGEPLYERGLKISQKCLVQEQS